MLADQRARAPIGGPGVEPGVEVGTHGEESDLRNAHPAEVQDRRLRQLVEPGEHRRRGELRRDEGRASQREIATRERDECDRLERIDHEDRHHEQHQRLRRGPPSNPRFQRRKVGDRRKSRDRARAFGPEPLLEQQDRGRNPEQHRHRAACLRRSRNRRDGLIADERAIGRTSRMRMVGIGPARRSIHAAAASRLNAARSRVRSPDIALGLAPMPAS